MKSMTGYGFGELQSQNYLIRFDIKSVNNRYCDINVRLPGSLFSYEDKIKRRIKDFVARGKVDVYLKLTELSDKSATLSTDISMANYYFDAGKKISSSLNIENNLTTKDIINMPGVLVEQDVNLLDQEMESLLMKSLDEALKVFIQSRLIEGKAIYEDFLEKIENINQFIGRIEKLSPISLKENEEKLKERITTHLDESEIDKQRLATECFLLIDKLSIDEEITRLKIHMESLKNIINSNDSIGRKIDFLLQEINREINTIGSKANNIEILNNVVLLKSEVERIREQVQNIE